MALRLDAQLLLAACCVAGSDGVIHKNEKRLLQYLAGKVGVDNGALETMFEKAKSDPTFYKSQLEMVRADPIKTLDILVSTAIADGKLPIEQRLAVRHLAQTMGIDEAYVDGVITAAQKAVDEKKTLKPESI